ncbi:gliding motility-associated C-terminal domain-containing protein, partial [bacterium]|nr:gliding motility-associated C-terminal domain-containing protein [bacterium]
RGNEFPYGDPGVSVGYVGDTTTMAIYFNPGWTLSSGSWVYVVLDSAINLLPVADTIVSSVIDSFLIDTEPPTFTYTGPTGSISDVSAAVSVSASDDICGSAVSYDSLVITSTVSGIDWHITTGVWDTTITGLLSGDSVVIHAYAHDVCSDTCGPNYGDSVWSFTVSTGVSVSLVEPVDLNGDGDTISACADQQIIWTVSSVGEIDSASIVATVCGTDYHWGDPELSASGDSIIWTPPAGFWTDGMTCDFSLVVCDVGGVCDTAAGQVIIDLAPPVFSGEHPADGSTILTDNVDVYVLATDSICGDAVPEFIHITSSVSGIDTTIPDTLGAHIGGFVDGDTVTVCVGAHDDCADYCGPNADTICWSFNVALGAVRAVVDEPRDVNSDACIQTACPCQPIRWIVYSQHGVDTATFEAVIDGITYDWGPEFSLTTVDDTTFTLVFDPSVAGTCWTENGYTIDYAITYLADTLSTDSLSADVGGSFTMLLAPPEISLSPLPPDSAFCESTLTFTTSMNDTVACTYDGSVSVHLFGTSGDSTFTLPFGEANIPVLSGDTICVSISAYNTADYGTTCTFTDTLYNWTAGLDTCYVIQCECNIAAFAGPDQYSCPGAPVVLGCDPVYSAVGITEYGINWYDAEGNLISTEENPTVSPETTTTYILETYGICVDGDTVRAYDTVTVYIDFQPTPAPTIVAPGDGTELTAGDYTLIWNSIDSTAATQPVYYQVILNGSIVADSLTDTTFDFSISCEETLTFMVVAFNSCYYELNDSCNPADSVSGYTSATYETSAVVIVWGEPCGGPVAEAVYPPNHTITSCEDQTLRFLVYDSQGVPLVVESLRVALNGTEYDTSAAFIAYTPISEDSGTVEVSPPGGNWDDNDTITVAITQLYNEFGRPLDTVVSITIYTDFTPPQATMLSPTPDSAVGERSPMVDISITDNVAGVAPESLVVIITTGTGTDTLHYPDGMAWDDATGGLLIDFNSLGISLADGETAYVEVHTCDSIDSEFCGSNCADYSWMFWYPYTVGCDRRPNPFTPNSDGKNEYAQFTFPDMGVKEGTIYIYDVHNVLVKQIDVPAGLSVSETLERTRWDGTDSNGDRVPQGVYLYVIISEGEVVCEGTVTVAR